MSCESIVTVCMEGDSFVKLTVTRLAKKFSAFWKKRQICIVFAKQISNLCPEPIAYSQIFPQYSLNLLSPYYSSHRTHSSKWSSSSRIKITILYVFLISCRISGRQVPISDLNLLALVIFRIDYKLCSYFSPSYYIYYNENVWGMQICPHRISKLVTR